MALALGSLIQYLCLLLFALIFLGSPLLNLFSGSSVNASDTDSHAEPDDLAYPSGNLTCPEHDYTVHILTRDPLVVYIPHFLSDAEADHLAQLAEPHYVQSTVYTAGEESLDQSIRHSQKAKLPRDTTVQCVESRARNFQGWRKDVFIERLMAQKYGVGGHYSHHFDWGALAPGSRAGRVSSFMVYLADQCLGGGTNFPNLEMPEDKRWCDYIDCDSQDPGVTFSPVKGNAVYWENFRPDGRGYEEVWHAGMPVKEGTKIGLNIWSWYQPGHVPKTASIGVKAEL